MIQSWVETCRFWLAWRWRGPFFGEKVALNDVEVPPLHEFPVVFYNAFGTY